MATATAALAAPPGALTMAETQAFAGAGAGLASAGAGPVARAGAATCPEP